MKIKLAICLEDSIYQERFVKCLMKHYAQEYEFHVFNSFFDLMEEGIDQYGGFILEDCDLKEQGWEEERLQRTLLLKEDDKYQEVYHIMEMLEALLSVQGVRLPVEQKNGALIMGVCSLTVPALQLPFAMTLNEIFGENRKTIFLDLQEFSGFIENGELGMEDVMAMAATGNYVRGRMLSAIGHTQTWDYIVPLKNSRCLLEGNKQMLQGLTDYLIRELRYEVIVINLGQLAMNLEGVIGICNQVFLLYPKGNTGSWRELRFLDELERKGEQDVLHRVQRMEIPTVSSADEDWKRLSEQWKWGNVGNMLRKIVWEEETFG